MDKLYNKYLKEVYRDKRQRVDFSKAGYKQDDMVNLITNALSKNNSQFEPDADSIKSIISKIKFIGIEK